MPSARRRRWPIGYSTATFSVLDPSLKKTCTALAIERFSRVEVVFRILRVLDADHLGAQRVDARIARDRILVMIGGELAEDQANGDHVLDAMIAVGGIVQRPGLVDDADRRFLRGDHDPLDSAQGDPSPVVQLEWRTPPRSAHETRREKKS